MADVFDRLFRVLKERMSIDQLILFYAYKKKTVPITIEEIAMKLSVPRSTAVDHLQTLSSDGFLKEEKEGRRRVFYAVPQIADKFYNALANLSSAYIYALDQIRKTELKELKGLSPEEEPENDKN